MQRMNREDSVPAGRNSRRNNGLRVLKRPERDTAAANFPAPVTKEGTGVYSKK
ncbi:hypothetical protein [Arsenicibacter rosenii]|uniref:hypothetical protein n=1 Tax=Arsenicibacter rosenii TaxID=1750698 RepID=UPI001C430450|nr:hypothetical protein [Arsenicibacter rosenii]